MIQIGTTNIVLIDLQAPMDKHKTTTSWQGLYTPLSYCFFIDKRTAVYATAELDIDCNQSYAC